MEQAPYDSLTDDQRKMVAALDVLGKQFPQDGVLILLFSEDGTMQVSAGSNAEYVVRHAALCTAVTSIASSGVASRKVTTLIGGAGR